MVAESTHRKARSNPAPIPEPGHARLTLADLNAALRDLSALDADLRAALDWAGPPPELRVGEPGLPGLLRIMVGQQVSTASAQAIWGRIVAAVRPLDAPTLLDVLDRRPEALGLSRQKRTYARILAEAIDCAALAPDTFPALPDDGVVDAIVALKGFGRWSAEIYLLFALGRRDAWPADDLALAVAVQRIKRLDGRPDRAAMQDLAEPWRPWRGAVATFLWHYYHRLGGQRQFADQPRAI